MSKDVIAHAYNEITRLRQEVAVLNAALDERQALKDTVERALQDMQDNLLLAPIRRAFRLNRTAQDLKEATEAWDRILAHLVAIHGLCKPDYNPLHERAVDMPMATCNKPVVSVETKELLYRGQSIDVTARQADVLHALAENFNEVVPLPVLTRRVFGVLADPKVRRADLRTVARQLNPTLNKMKLFVIPDRGGGLMLADHRPRKTIRRLRKVSHRADLP